MTEPDSPDSPDAAPAIDDETRERPVLSPDDIPASAEPATQPDTVDVPVPSTRPLLQLDAYAVSDVGRVRKDNQDSGCSGPWLLAVCDGVGGAARGDIASGTAIGELRQLDEPPGSVDVIDRVNDGLNEAHVSIGAQVDADPSLNGTSTTATVALHDGQRLAVGHIGDSRAYLLRDGELSQLTNDHTFVQSLIDEGRITEAEARVHPHRNLILKALDGLHDAEPDLFALEMVPGDRLFLCSDGACGVLENDRIAELLADGTPEFTAIELVRASLDAGSSDNVTCIVADVVDPEQHAPHDAMVVGAAADLRQRRRGLFRGHRSGDTGELEPITAEIPEGIDYAIAEDPPLDPEALRYAPQPPPRFVWARRLLAAAVVLGLVWVALGTAWWWSQQRYYVGDRDGVVVIYRGVDVPGLSRVYEESDLRTDGLLPADRRRISSNDKPSYGSLERARAYVQRIAEHEPGTDDTTDESDQQTEQSPTPPAPAAPTTTPPTQSGGAADLAPTGP